MRDASAVMDLQFKDRYEAGRVLSELLAGYADNPMASALALPRGGVPVAAVVAAALHIPLDVFLVRKLGVPGHQELAMGAIASGGVRVINEDIVRELGITPQELDAVASEEARELERRERLYRGDRPPLLVRGRIVLLVDDGAATGASMRAAIASMRRLGPERIVVALPTAAPTTRQELERSADEVICAITPEPFWAVGAWYADFRPVGDDEVRRLLDIGLPGLREAPRGE